MTDCIIFQGSRMFGGTGYGQRCVKGKKWLAHRYAYFEKYGPIPKPLLVCHRCNNKGCVNVDHLYLATNQQNALDAVRDGLWRPSNAAKKVCPKCGGPYFVAKDGYRKCRPCRQKWHAAAKLKRLAAMQPSPSLDHGARDANQDKP